MLHQGVASFAAFDADLLMRNKCCPRLKSKEAA